MIVEVGKIKKKVKYKIFRYKYSDIVFDENDWADINFYLPQKFDLVLVKTKNNKQFNAWWEGKEWMGLRLKPTDVITHWQRIQYIGAAA